MQQREGGDDLSGFSLESRELHPRCLVERGVLERLLIGFVRIGGASELSQGMGQAVSGGSTSNVLVNRGEGGLIPELQALLKACRAGFPTLQCRLGQTLDEVMRCGAILGQDRLIVEDGHDVLVLLQGQQMGGVLSEQYLAQLLGCLRVGVLQHG